MLKPITQPLIWLRDKALGAYINYIWEQFFHLFRNRLLYRAALANNGH